MKHIHVQDRSDRFYPQYALVVAVGGKLFIRPCKTTIPSIEETTEETTRNWSEAELEANDNPDTLAVVRFTHIPYADPEEAQRYAVDLILEMASRELGIPYAVSSSESKGNQ